MLFYELVNELEKIQNINSQKELIDKLVNIFTKTNNKKELYELVFLLTPIKTLNIGEAIIIQSIAITLNRDINYIKQQYSKYGDLGITYYELSNINNNKSNFTINDIYTYINKLKSITAINEKIKYISQILSKLSNIEAKYFIKIILNQLRLNISEILIVKALAKYFNINELPNIYKNIYDLEYLLANIDEIKKNINQNDINNNTIQLFKPVKPQLAKRINDFSELINNKKYNIFGNYIAEPKYDGIRLQIHKKKDIIRIYTRNMKEITNQFPDIVNEVKKINIDTLILDGEGVITDNNGNILHFYDTLQRKRIHNIDYYLQKYKLKVFCFDILLYNNNVLINKPYIERRHYLIKLFRQFKSNIIKITPMHKFTDIKSLQKIYKYYIDKNYEGLILKNIHAKYEPGLRTKNWLKLKKSFGNNLNDTLDVVVIGFDNAKGKFAKYKIGALLVAIYDKLMDRFIPITKVLSGLSFTELNELYELIKNDIIDKPQNYKIYITKKYKVDNFVKPKIVLTISATELIYRNNEISLRDPRIILIRNDKDIYDITTLQEIKEIIK